MHGETGGGGGLDSNRWTKIILQLECSSWQSDPDSLLLPVLLARMEAMNNIRSFEERDSGSSPNMNGISVESERNFGGERGFDGRFYHRVDDGERGTVMNVEPSRSMRSKLQCAFRI